MTNKGKLPNMKNRQILKWLWHTSRSFRLQAFLNIVMGLLAVALDFAFILFTKLAIDAATGRSDCPLNVAGALLIGVVLSKVAVGFSNRWIAALLGVKAQNRMQLRLFRHLLQGEWQGMERYHSGDVLNRLERDVQDITTTITETLPFAFCVGIRLLAAFLYLYAMDAHLACIIVVIAPLFALLSRLYIRKMRRITREIRNTDSSIQSLLTESIQHRMVLKTLERTETMAERLEATQYKLRSQVRHSTRFSSFSASLMSIGFGAGYLVTFLWGASRLQDGTITYGMMVAFIQLVGQIQLPFRDIIQFIPKLISAFTAAERMSELEGMPLEEQGGSICFPQGAGIRFNNVSFAYEKEERPVINQLTYIFPPGSTTAIVGETGAGKTTLIRLILALLKPQEGTVEIYGDVNDDDNVNVDKEVNDNVNDDDDNNVDKEVNDNVNDDDDDNDDDIESINPIPVSPLTRCNLTYVPQGNTLFSGTIRENLFLGNPDATEEEMKEVLECACADFVFDLPEGLDARCSEGGGGLSEGQAQRIAIARSLLRRGNILLFDEATSALDGDTEEHLLRNIIQRRKAHQTFIFITHRPAVTQYCTQVLRI